MCAQGLGRAQQDRAIGAALDIDRRRREAQTRMQCHAQFLLFLATHESEGYYFDYSQDARRDMGVALRDGYVHQGRASPFRNGATRGEPSGHLPSVAFVNFLQNHDQIGNRAFGDRLTTLVEAEEIRTLTALLLLSPQIPLLFMGEEWGCRTAFPFFCDFGAQLAAAVTEGRRREFERFPKFHNPETRARIPDPKDPATFTAAVLDWNEPSIRFYKSQGGVMQDEWTKVRIDGAALRKLGADLDAGAASTP